MTNLIYCSRCRALHWVPRRRGDLLERVQTVLLTVLAAFVLECAAVGLITQLWWR